MENYILYLWHHYERIYGDKGNTDVMCVTASLRLLLDAFGIVR